VSVVSNTGPLIALAKADSLGILKALFETVLTPPAVQRELFAKVGAESRRLEEAAADFIRTTPVSLSGAPRQIAELAGHLGPGEQEAIALAAGSQALLVIDERLGRSAARRLGIRVTGTVGVLLEARRRGALERVAPVLNRIRHNGYWLSDELVRVALTMAGEVGTKI
jgi:uncharacterized protein